MGEWSGEQSGEQLALEFVLMRGGTSKAVFLKEGLIPGPGPARDSLILAIMGSPDPRQIDGLGGADLLTTKLAIVGPPTRADADLDYTFAQVSISEPVVDYDINCGNISAAVGAYAVDEGLVAVDGTQVRVRIHNTNTGRILLADVPIVNGAAAIEGDLLVHGVPGTGAPIALDFSQTGGGITGSLLPTGNAMDVLDAPSGPVEVTIMDLANLTVFVGADSVGMTGTEGPAEFNKQQLELVLAVKESASKLLGMDPGGLIPVPAVVSPPAGYTSFASGEAVEANDTDLLARVVGGRPPVLHKAYPGTLAACTGVAARIPGTVVHSIVRAERNDQDQIRIGHTSGVMPVRAAVSHSAGSHGAVADGSAGWRADQAIYHRTARRLAEGTTFVRRTTLAPNP